MAQDGAPEKYDGHDSKHVEQQKHEQSDVRNRSHALCQARQNNLQLRNIVEELENPHKSQKSQRRHSPTVERQVARSYDEEVENLHKLTLVVRGMVQISVNWTKTMVCLCYTTAETRLGILTFQPL
jgi:hypothetical protein